MFALPIPPEEFPDGLETDVLLFEDELVTNFPLGTGALGSTSVFTNKASASAMPQNTSEIREKRNQLRFSCTEPSELT